MASPTAKAIPLATLLLVACSSRTEVGGGGGASGGEGGHTTSFSQGGAHQGGSAPTGGSGGSGGTTGPTWKHACSDTGIAVDGVGPIAVYDENCPDDFWAAQHYDGAVAYDTHAGFVGSLDFHACMEEGTRHIRFHVLIDGPGSAMLTGGTYGEGGQLFELISGDMTITADGDVGQVISGSYTGLFGPQSGSGEPLQLSGDLAACHLPVRALP